MRVWDIKDIMHCLWKCRLMQLVCRASDLFDLCKSKKVDDLTRRSSIFVYTFQRNTVRYIVMYSVVCSRMLIAELFLEYTVEDS